MSRRDECIAVSVLFFEGCVERLGGVCVCLFV